MLMHRMILLATMISVAIAASAQHQLVPAAYKSIKEVEGDLDKDGIAEKVVVYDVTRDDPADGVERDVVIFKKQGNNWAIWYRSKTAIGDSKSGGMMGDPFGDIEIKNGVLVISQEGGSSWKWSMHDKYRFQNGQMVLIGYTSYGGKPCEYWESIDYNLATGKLVYSKEYERCKDGEGAQFVYKKENETFMHKLKAPILFEKRESVKEKPSFITPRYRRAIYI